RYQGKLSELRKRQKPGGFLGPQNQWPANSGRWVRFPSASATSLPAWLVHAFRPVRRQPDLLCDGKTQIAVLGEGVSVGPQGISGDEHDEVLWVEHDRYQTVWVIRFMK